MVLEFGERLDLVLWETCHIYATCQAYRAEADFQHMGMTTERGSRSKVNDKSNSSVLNDKPENPTSRPSASSVG